jgi:hypothetical protein
MGKEEKKRVGERKRVRENLSPKLARGTSLGRRCWLAAVKMGKEEKKRVGERKRVRENLSPKPGDLL